MSELKLLARDAEDLEVISAHVQDAIVRVGDMGYVPADRRFAFLMNRFAWESNGGGRKGERRRTAMHFDYVLDAKVKGVNLAAEDGALELLSITFEPAEAPAGTIELAFAGGGTVRLTVECIEARLRDLGAAWGARARPVHDEAGKA